MDTKVRDTGMMVILKIIKKITKITYLSLADRFLGSR